MRAYSTLTLLGALLLGNALPAQAATYELNIAAGEFRLSDGSRPALTINGQSPGLQRLRPRHL